MLLHLLTGIIASIAFAVAHWRQVTPLTVYQIVVTGFALMSLTVAVGDWFSFRRPQSASSSQDEKSMPSLSILIPARNEEATIGDCLRSLLAQEYEGALEFLVLDVQSTDGTAEAICNAAGSDTRVRRIAGDPVLAGWKGKPNALRQLAAAATGEMLLLTDADCEFLPGALNAVIRYRESCNADCLSLIPDLKCGSFWEQVIIPLQYNVIFLTLPIRKVYRSRNPAIAAANGAFLLLPAAVYSSVGGHGAVRKELAEDIKFAQFIKRSGYRLVYGDGSQTYSVRMYDSLRGIWDGFSKNLFPAMGKNPAILAVWCLFHLTTQVLPFFILIGTLVSGSRSLAMFALPCLQVAIALGIRTALAIRFRGPLWAVITHPLGWLITMAIGINSAYLTYSRKGHTWKGRVYET